MRRTWMLSWVIALSGCGDDAGGGAETSGTMPTTSGTTSSAGVTTESEETGAPATTGDTSSEAGGSTLEPSGSESGSEASSGPDSTTSGGLLSFEDDIWPVFSIPRKEPFSFGGDNCITDGTCHGSATPGAMLPMPDRETAYEELLNVASVSGECGGTVRVVPGDPDNSCLVVFYQNRLQDQLDWVEQAETDLMAEWIAQGANP